MNFLVILVLAYFLGSIPFAVIIGRMKGVDILSTGSRNPGMTNVMRSLGTAWGITCFILDVLKGAIPAAVAHVMITQPIGPFDPQFLGFMCGVAAVTGHCLSPFLGFKGGKGVSTALGAMIGTSPLIAAACFGLFIVLLATSRLMSLASVIAVGSVLVFGWVIPGQTPQLLPVYAILAAFVAYRHRANFARIRAGTEPRFKFGRSTPTESAPEPPKDEDSASK